VSTVSPLSLPGMKRKGQGRQGGGCGKSNKMEASAKDTGSSSNNVVVKEEEEEKKKKDRQVEDTGSSSNNVVVKEQEEEKKKKDRQVEDTGSSSNNVLNKQEDAPEIAALVEALPTAPTSDAGELEQVQQPPGQPVAQHGTADPVDKGKKRRADMTREELRESWRLAKAKSRNKKAGLDQPEMTPEELENKRLGDLIARLDKEAAVRLQNRDRKRAQRARAAERKAEKERVATEKKAEE
jgi:hypothetical protein